MLSQLPVTAFSAYVRETNRTDQHVQECCLRKRKGKTGIFQATCSAVLDNLLLLVLFGLQFIFRQVCLSYNVAALLAFSLWVQVRISSYINLACHIYCEERSVILIYNLFYN